MAFEWTEYLELARRLQEHKGPDSREAARRSAVSRAYYALYGTAHRYCLVHGYAPSNTGGDHKGVREFMKTAEIDRADVADVLLELSAWRVQCDYRDTVPGDLTAKSLWAVARAEAAIARLT